MQRWKILAVCGMGLGSSMILRMQAEKAAKVLGIDVDVELADIGSAAAQAAGADIILTSPALAGQLMHARALVIPITNYMNLNEMVEKLNNATQPPSDM